MSETRYQRARRLRLERAAAARQRANQRREAMEVREREVRLYTPGLFKVYGLLPEQFECLMHVQDGRCAICHALFDAKVSPCVDHCHATGMVRGLLCAKCNPGLGLFNDDADLLRVAVDYLRKPPGWRFNYGRRVITKVRTPKSADVRDRGNVSKSGYS